MIFKDNLTLEDFKKMSDLESKYYDESHITPYEEAYRCYLSFPWSNKALWDNDILIGFLDLYPIKNDLFNQIKAGVFNDKNAGLDDVLDIFNNCDEKINMFLSCIVIDKEYRKTGALKKLLKEQIDFYKDQGVFFNVSSIITDNVTKQGEGFSKRIGLTKVIETDHNSVVYIGDYMEFVKRIEEL